MTDEQAETLRDVLSAAAADAGLSMQGAGIRMGGRNTAAAWLREDALPNVRSLVAFGQAVGVTASELLARAGL